MDKPEYLPSYEANPRLRYPLGWSEILQAPDAIDYQMMLQGLTDLSQQKLREANVPWAGDTAEIFFRWQRAVELVASTTISPGDLDQHTEADTVETALITVQANLESLEWEEDGIVFVVPDLYTGEEAVVDLRDLGSLYPDFEAQQWLSEVALSEQIGAYQF